jgi:hypothetical protein
MRNQPRSSQVTGNSGGSQKLETHRIDGRVENSAWTMGRIQGTLEEQVTNTELSAAVLQPPQVPSGWCINVATAYYGYIYSMAKNSSETT